MFIALILLMVFSLVELMLHYDSKLYWGFFGCFIGIFIMMSASVMYTLKLSGYTYYNSIDHYIYFIFINISIAITTVARIYNMGMAVVMLSMTYITCVTSLKQKAPVVISVLSVLLFIISNDPVVTEDLFYKINSFTVSDNLSFYKMVEKVCRTYSYVLFIVHLVLPMILIFCDFLRAKVYINRRRLLTTLTAQLIIVIFLLYFYVFSAHSTFAPWNVDLLKFPYGLFSQGSSFGIAPSTIVLFVLIFFLSIFFNPFDYFKLTTKKKYVKNSRELNHNLRMVLHSNKNILVTVEKLAEQAIDLKELKPEILTNNLNDIRSIASNGLNHLSRIIDLINDVPHHAEETDIIVCIEKALTSLNCSGIYIERRYAFDSMILRTNPTHITECFINLFQNCIEAIHTRGNTDGRIIIKANIESPYVYIEIMDNGCGIPKNKIGSIFSPLVSTKQNAKNWGVGLNYVENVVNLYNGNIWVKSAVNSYTTFQLSFPFKS